MKKAIRVSALLGAAVMLMGVCTACNGGTGSSSAAPDAPSVKGLGGITVKMAFPYEIVMTPGLSAENDAFISRVGEVEKKYDCKIEFVYKSQTDYYNTLVQNCLAGQPTGDVINVGASRLPDYARKGILEPLEGYDAYKQYLGNQLSKKASDWMSLDGKTYGMCAEPLEQRMFVTFNKRIFKENNLDDPYELAKAGNWTWEKFTEYAKKCTRYDSSGKITQYGFHGDLFSVMASAIASNMGDVVSFENNTYRLALDSPNSLEALNQVEKWMHTDRIMNAEHVYWDGPMRMFEKGRAAMILCPGIWVPYERFNTTLTDDDYGVIYFPKGPKASDYVASYDGWECICLPTSTKIDKDTLIRLYVETKLPADFDASSDVAEIFTNKYGASLRDEGSLEVLLDIQTNSKFRLIRYRELFDLAGDSLPNFANELATGEKTAAQVVAEVKQPLQAYLDDNYNK